MEQKEKLYRLQDEVLSALSEFAGSYNFPFVLTGGTALVRFLLKNHYRVSYDLDFFSTTCFSVKELTEIVKEIADFLSKRFHFEIKEPVGTPEIPIIKCEISSESCGFKIDFVGDNFFSGIFQPVKFLVNLYIEPLEAIYFRKVYSLLSSSVQGIAVDRIKDTLDLIQLDRNVKPFTNYVIEDFCAIWKQNIPREISPLHILKTLKNLFLNVEERKEVVDKALSEVYYTSITTEEVLKWLRFQIEKLSQL